MSVIRSRENPRVKAWMRLADDPRERRSHGLALIEGVHLVQAFLHEGGARVQDVGAEACVDLGQGLGVARQVFSGRPDQIQGGDRRT